MTDRDALYAAILAAPDDDLPRLVLADWLEENGQAGRADLIRHGVTHRRVLHADNIPWKRTRRGIFLAEWVTSRGPCCPRGGQRTVRDILPPPDATLRFNAEFYRGFLSHIECASRWWEIHGDAIIGNHPLRSVSLATVPYFASSVPIWGGEPRWWRSSPHDSPPRKWSHQEVIEAAERFGLLHESILYTLVRLRWPAVPEWDLHEFP